MILKLLKKTFSALVLKVLMMVISFFCTLYLTKLYSIEVAGEYFTLNTGVVFLSLIMRYGYDNLIIKGISQNRDSYIFFRKLKKLVLKIPFFILCWMLLLYVLFGKMFVDLIFEDLSREFILLAIIASIFYSILLLNSFFLQGYGFFKLSIFFNLLILHVLFLCGLFLFGEHHPFYIFSGSVLLACIISEFSVRKITKNMHHCDSMEKEDDDAFFKKLNKDSFDLFVSQISLAIVPYVSIFMLTSIEGAASSAGFSVSQRIANLLGLFLFAVNSFSVPVFAKLYKEGKYIELFAYYRRISLLLTVIMFFVVAPMLLFRIEVLELFSKSYSNFHMVLLVLIFNQVVNVCFGPVGYILMMSDRGRQYRNITLSVNCTSFIFMYIFVSEYGAVGLAVLTLLSTLIVNVLSYMLVLDFRRKV